LSTRKTPDVVPMNYHFTTTKAHIVLNGGIVEELIIDEGLNVESHCKFKGNMNITKLRVVIEKHGAENIPFVRLEAGTNLIGGQPISLENIQEVRKVCDEFRILLVLDASLLADNLYFIKEREEQCNDMSMREITSAKGRCNLY
jgi:tyrosine phenol-lyase